MTQFHFKDHIIQQLLIVTNRSQWCTKHEKFTKKPTMQYTENDLGVMYLQPSRWKLFIDMQTSESSLVLPEKRNAVVMKRVKKSRKQWNLASRRGRECLTWGLWRIFSFLWWDNEEKAIVYVHLTIKIIEHTLKFRNIYNDWWYCHLNTTVFFFLAANRKKSSSILHQGLKSISPMIQKRCL